MFTFEVFEALSDRNRRTILRLLTAEDLSAGALAAHFEISRPAVSRHLRVLRQAGLVSQRRVGRRRIYRLEPAVLQDAADWLFEVASRRILAREEETEDLGRPTERRTETPIEAPDWKQW